MLRSLGFLTGMALTAVLTLALTDQMAVDGLRRSAETLFAGPVSARPVTPSVATTEAGGLGARTGSGAGAAGPEAIRAVPGPSATSRSSQDETGPPLAASATTLPSDIDGKSTPRTPDRAGNEATVAALGRPDGSPERPVAGRAEPDPDTGDSSNAGPMDGMSVDPPTGDMPAAPGASTPAPSPARSAVARTPPATPVQEHSSTPTAATGQAGNPAPATVSSGRAPVAAAHADEATYPDRTTQPDDTGTMANERTGPLSSDIRSASGEPEAYGGWHAFWTPFHSEASAEGFARHLRRTTDTEYQVIRTAPGEYRVAFWHDGEDQRGEQLSAIEQASGLRLHSGEL